MLDDCAKESVTPSWNLGCGLTRPFPPCQNDRPSPKWPDFLCFLADSVQNTILNALEEVENALVSYTRERNRYEALTEAVSSNKGAVTLANSGLSDLLNVLDAQRNLFQSESEQSQSEAPTAVNFVALYKALGGDAEAFAPGQLTSSGGSAAPIVGRT